MKNLILVTAILGLLISGSALAGGPKGANPQMPLVFGPYDSGSQDSGICGNMWANDVFTRTYIVTPIADGSFQVTELYNGTFTTLAGPGPNGPCETNIFAGTTGQFYGNYAIKIPAPADFNFTAKCPEGCTTAQFMSTFFGLNWSTWATPYAWQFYYRSGSWTWDNTDHGNTQTGSLP
jgi:hypothetical protein